MPTPHLLCRLGFHKFRDALKKYWCGDTYVFQQCHRSYCMAEREIIR